MNKYIFKIALVMMLLIAPMFMPQQEHYVAADATVINVDGGSFQLNVDKTATLVDASGVSSVYTIPASVTHNNVTYSVTKIGGEAFYNNKALTKVIMPDTILEIEDGVCLRKQKVKQHMNICNMLKTHMVESYGVVHGKLMKDIS